MSLFSSSDNNVQVSPIVPSVPVLHSHKRSSIALPIALFAQVAQEEVNTASASVADINSIGHRVPPSGESVEQAEESKSSSAVTTSQSRTSMESSNDNHLSFDDFDDEEEYRMYLAEINKTHPMRDAERSVRLKSTARQLERAARRIQARREKENSRLYQPRYLMGTNRSTPIGLHSRPKTSISKHTAVANKVVCDFVDGAESEEASTESDGEDSSFNTAASASLEGIPAEFTSAESSSPLPHMGNALQELFRQSHEELAIAEKKREAEEKQDLFSPVQSMSRPASSFSSYASPSAYVDGRPEVRGYKFHQATFVSHQRSKASPATAVVTIQQYRPTTSSANAVTQPRRTSHPPARSINTATETRSDGLVSPNRHHRRLASVNTAKATLVTHFAKSLTYASTDPSSYLRSASQGNSMTSASHGSTVPSSSTHPSVHSSLPQLLSEQKKHNQSAVRYLHRMQRQRLEIDQVAQESHNLALQLMRNSRSVVASETMDMVGCIVSSRTAANRSLKSSSSFSPSKPFDNMHADGFHQLRASSIPHQRPAAARSSPGSAPSQPAMFASKRAEAIYHASQRAQVVAPIRIIDCDWNAGNSPSVTEGLLYNRSSADSTPIPTHPSVFSSHHFTLKPSTPLLIGSA